MILPDRFGGKVRRGCKGGRTVSGLRLITVRWCTTECLAMAREGAFPRFVNCWSMSGAFRRNAA